jgi:hypothetical protein
MGSLPVGIPCPGHFCTSAGNGSSFSACNDELSGRDVDGRMAKIRRAGRCRFNAFQRRAFPARISGDISVLKEWRESLNIRIDKYQNISVVFKTLD